MNDDRFPSPKRDTRPQPRSLWALLFAIAWFALAGAMVIWPHALGSPDYSCADDDEAGILCFIITSWGTPAGIAISLVYGLITLWSFFKPGTRTEATTSEQQATSLAQTARLPGVHRTDTSPLSYGVRFLIATAIVILSCITGIAALTLIGMILMIPTHTGWTGLFVDDILPFVILISVAGLGGFGILKLVGLLRFRPPPE